ncbi:hypothetical protein ABPG75_005155 [Micractinium tetrahymenae]
MSSPDGDEQGSLYDTLVLRPRVMLDVRHVDCRLPDSTPSILRAAAAGDLPALQALLAESPAAVHEAAGNGVTATHYAAAVGHVPSLLAVLAAGADPSTADDSGCTPLIVASLYGQVNALQALVQAGVSLEAVTPLNDATSTKACLTALQWAALAGQEGSLRALLAAGASLEPSRAGPEFSPALHLAAMQGHEACLHILLEAGAPLEGLDSAGETALVAACRRGRDACLRALLSAGANVDAAGSKGCALLVASNAGHVKCAIALQQAGVSQLLPNRALAGTIRALRTAGVLSTAKQG